MLTEERTEFGRAARSAGVLTAGRQIGAVVLTAGVLLLPRFVGDRDLSPFLWVYFAQLLVTSLLNLGLERHTTRAVAGHASPAATLGAALIGRAATAVATPVALAVVLYLVRVQLPLGAWVGATVWTLAVQFQGVLFAALRAAGHATAEATIALTGRLVQTAVLLSVAMIGADVVRLVAAVAGIEVIVTAVAGVLAARRVGVSLGSRLPYRRLAVYAVLEISAFAYLRADLVIVGRLLGSDRGATYGLGYRVVDAMVSLATPALLVLFAYASSQTARGAALAETRRRCQSLLPQVGVVLAAIAIVAIGPLATLLTGLEPAVPALRILLASVPLTYLIGVEALLLSAEDRNAPVLITGAVALGASIVLNVALVPHFAMLGAAAALVVTEVIQVAGLASRSAASTASAGRLLPLVALLLGGAIAINLGAGVLAAAMLLVAAAGAAVVFGSGVRDTVTA